MHHEAISYTYRADWALIMQPIEFVDLKSQQKLVGKDILAALARVMQHEQYIFGPEVKALEAKLGEIWGGRHVLACSNGTAALRLALMAGNIGTGDTVIAPSFSFIATHEPPVLQGAEIFFCDVCRDSYNITADTLRASIKAAQKRNKRIRAVISVDLFGMPVDYAEIRAVCDEHALLFISDSAQAFGASWENACATTIADYTCVSFFPAKVLGCYGDAGAIFCNDDDANKRLRTIAFHGSQKQIDKNAQADEYIHVGDNIRMETMQAAILLEKLKIFDDEIETRRSIAKHYNNNLAASYKMPHTPATARPVWAQYSLLCERRGELQQYLQQQSIPTRAYYRKPTHLQQPYKHYGQADLENTEYIMERVLSLPIHPYLSEQQQDYIIHHLNLFAGKK